eukprot:365436-Chlamydomonas_euryale.AAC.2
MARHCAPSPLLLFAHNLHGSGCFSIHNHADVVTVNLSQPCTQAYERLVPDSPAPLCMVTPSAGCVTMQRGRGNAEGKVIPKQS